MINILWIANLHVSYLLLVWLIDYELVILATPYAHVRCCSHICFSFPFLSPYLQFFFLPRFSFFSLIVTIVTNIRDPDIRGGTKKGSG
ncbi:hypothetical protein HOY82DRAFT_207422 [Tuber indicum]|nr:hypothetical protein HOY82DRAFT_207422 [Tuber indicum]